MENLETYNRLNKHLKGKFGERTLKVCVDGGFTCPNRDGLKSTLGCLFCSGRGSGDHLTNKKSIKEQITETISYKANRANKFIVYFQSFTNTYAPIELLKQKYYEAINTSNKIVGINIATRPDCVNKEVVDLLCEINKKTPVSVELGLQTSNENTGKIINRCYSTTDFINASKLLSKNNIEVVAHIMVGLPTENHSHIVDTISLINTLPITGIKIHSTYILKNTPLEQLYYAQKYTPLDLLTYLNELEYIITHLKPSIIIHRLSGDPPKNLLIAPLWCANKKIVINSIEKRLREKKLFQGIYYKNTPNK